MKRIIIECDVCGGEISELPYYEYKKHSESLFILTEEIEECYMCSKCMKAFKVFANRKVLKEKNE